MGGPDQTQVAFVDQVRQRYALVLILLGDRDHEAEVGSDELVQCLVFSSADRLGEPGLLVAVDERVRRDLFEVLIKRALSEGPAAGLEAHTPEQRSERKAAPVRRAAAR